MQEARIRRAWGLDGEAPRLRMPERAEPQPAPRQADRFSAGFHKRRFVQDGEVPVMVVHGLTGRREQHAETAAPRPTAAAPTNRLEVAETALAAEIAARDKAEKALAEAQAIIQQLQTKIGHSDLAHQDTVAALQREREAAAELRASLAEAQELVAAAQSAQLAAETALSAALVHPSPAEPATRPAGAAAEHVRAEPVRRGRKPGRPPGSKNLKPAKAAAQEAAPAREPKPVRWWLSAKRGAKAR